MLMFCVSITLNGVFENYDHLVFKQVTLWLKKVADESCNEL